MFSLKSKVAVVVGGSSGIGARTAEVLAEAGARVVIGDIAEERGEALCEKLRAEGHEACFVRADVAEPADVEHLMDRAAETYGSVDVVHNNVAALDQLAKDKWLTDLEVDVWDRVLEVNLRGVMLGCKYAVPHMLRAGGGSIINTASSRAFGGAIDCSAYGTSKLAIIGLTRYVATMYGKQGIRCNAVAPGAILTEDALRHNSREALDGMLKHYLTPRLGRADDVAKCVLFLASADSSFITGQVIPIDGGLGAHQPYFADTTS